MSLDKPSSGRPFYKRITVVASIVLAALAAMEAQAALPTGTTEALKQLGANLAELGVVLGIYRHLQS